MPSLSSIRNVVFFARPGLSPEILDHLEEILLHVGIQCFRTLEACERPDLILSLGGDGTLLRASAWAAEHEVPVLGINHGTLGFLTALGNKQDVLGALHPEGVVWEERIRMRVSLINKKGSESRSWCALNDAVIERGPARRILPLRTVVGGKLMATYKADGLILCTPTGSTAYNMAAGGPILHPDSACFAITPIAPHSVTHRIPVVVSSSTSIEVELMGPEEQDAVLMIDGQEHMLIPGEKIRISGDCKPLRLCPPSASVFEIMREKMGWDTP